MSARGPSLKNAAAQQWVRSLGCYGPSRAVMVRAERFACPLRSHLHLLRDGKSIVDLNTEVAHGAFDLGVSRRCGGISRLL